MNKEELLNYIENYLLGLRNSSTTIYLKDLAGPVEKDLYLCTIESDESGPSEDSLDPIDRILTCIKKAHDFSIEIETFLSVPIHYSTNLVFRSGQVTVNGCSDSEAERINLPILMSH